MNQTIMDRVRGIAADLFAMPVEELGPDSSPATIENWDSMQQLNLTLELEMTFGIKLGPDDIQGMTSLATVASTVERKLDTQSAGVN